MRMFIFVVLVILCGSAILVYAIPPPPTLPILPGSDSSTTASTSTSTSGTTNIDTDTTGTGAVSSSGGPPANVEIPADAMNELLNMYPPEPVSQPQTIVQPTKPQTISQQTLDANQYDQSAGVDGTQAVSDQTQGTVAGTDANVASSDQLGSESISTGVVLSSDQRLANVEAQLSSVGSVVSDVSQKVQILPSIASDVASLKSDVSVIKSKINSAVTAVDEMPGKISSSAGAPWYVPTLLLIILFVIIGGIAMLVFTREGDKPDEKLMSYVNQCVKSGYSRDDIRRALVQGGYSEKDISSVLK